MSDHDAAAQGNELKLDREEAGSLESTLELILYAPQCALRYAAMISPDEGWHIMTEYALFLRLPHPHGNARACPAIKMFQPTCSIF